MARKIGIVLLLLSCALSQNSLVNAQSMAILHNFGDGTISHDGLYSGADLVKGRDGNFYGLTQYGGTSDTSGSSTSGFGTVFKMTPSGTTSTLLNFDFEDNVGAGSQAALAQGKDGNFYGVTEFGGTASHGTVYKLTPTGTLITLHSFSATDSYGDNSDGTYPQGTLVQGNDGNFYGTAQYGGSANRGTVFKITPAGTFTTLHDFEDTTVENDGAVPTSGLIQGNDGDFYGTTPYGGAVNDGAVFKITSAGTLTSLASFGFNGNNASLPLAGLVQGHDGNFYGTTYEGGTAGTGTVFKVTPAGALVTLVNFDTTNGAYPFAGLVLASDGNFYGTAGGGGSSNDGVIFRMEPSGALAVLHNFDDGTVPNDGIAPVAGLIEGTTGNFYGTTSQGGSAGSGTVFRFSLAGSGVSPIWSVRDVAAVPDGTARLLWTRSDGAAGVWTMNARDVETVVAPTYGPYTGWNAKAISVAGDETSRLLWTRADGAAGVWKLDSAGNLVMVGPTYGPFAGWTATDLATAPDGSSRLLWTNSNGMTGLWTLTASGTEAVIGTTYSPTQGLAAKSVGVAGDGTARILLTSFFGKASLWTFTTTNTLKATGPIYGTFTDSQGTWAATSLGTSTDGTSQVLWRRSDSATGVWTFDASGTKTTIGPIYGPYNGYAAMALDSENGTSRVLWVNSSRAAGLWSFGSNDFESTIGSVYGPY